MRKTHKVIDKNGFSFDSDDRAYFIGTPDECADWIAQKENPEWYRVTYTVAEDTRRTMCRNLFGDADFVMNGTEEKALEAALTLQAYYQKRLDKSAESAADYIEMFVNNGGCPMDAFVELMTRKHRTLQQSFTKLCLKWIEKAASPEYTYDGRNEASHKQCKRLVDNWLLKHPDDGIHMDADMLKGNPPSKWLPTV